jgi:hypothetical protein
MFKLYAYFTQKEYRNYVDYTHECPLKKNEKCCNVGTETQ